MLENIYLLYSIVAFVFIGLSFHKQDQLWLHWMTVILTIVLSINSAYIELPYCELDSGDAWSCNIDVYDGNWPMVYFWFGIFLIMFVFAVLMSVYQPWKDALNMRSGMADDGG